MTPFLALYISTFAYALPYSFEPNTNSFTTHKKLYLWLIILPQ
ncbi:protein of unknown function [Candidatus Nitrosocosmicus franklandus]|uniref:Uncharacterized protein n=1 Tax=Candidatus Nitrosocosmicus franklandianus TaxID=1798806 RepID=A0A484IC76_9ARCH|nr:protein of unknown function [Candidatus Nitrosocosmicus franklandus]